MTLHGFYMIAVTGMYEIYFNWNVKLTTPEEATRREQRDRTTHGQTFETNGDTKYGQYCQAETQRTNNSIGWELKN